MTEGNPEKRERAATLRLAADLVSAYLGNHNLPPARLPAFIRSVFGSLDALKGGGEAGGEPLKPAVPIPKSVTPGHLVCLEDGKKLKMLKRHLRTAYGLTPDAYRAKWGLAADYPMVAPTYAAQRSAFAKKIGLGRKRGANGRRRGR